MTTLDDGKHKGLPPTAIATYGAYIAQLSAEVGDITGTKHKLPFEEAAALYQLEERNQLVYWRPYFTRIDITRIEDHLALQNLRLYLRNIEVDPTPLLAPVRLFDLASIRPTQPSTQTARPITTVEIQRPSPHMII
jgi:hypothetical protein